MCAFVALCRTIATPSNGAWSSTGVETPGRRGPHAGRRPARPRLRTDAALLICGSVMLLATVAPFVFSIWRELERPTQAGAVRPPAADHERLVEFARVSPDDFARSVRTYPAQPSRDLPIHRKPKSDGTCALEMSGHRHPAGGVICAVIVAEQRS